MKKSIIASVVIIFLVITFASNTEGVYPTESESVIQQVDEQQLINADSYTPHDPITITSNADFMTQGWPGNGTSEDPYVIAGLSISSERECINIVYTTAFFVVNNCIITGQRSNIGIVLEGVSNGTISNCIIDRHSSGIYLEWSSSCKLIANNVTNSSHNGIELESSPNCTLKDNFVFNCLYNGIELTPNTDNCILINNTASKNGRMGFSISGWGISTLTNNTAVENSDSGFFIDSIENSTVLLNSASNNLKKGFYLHALENCNLTLNTASNNVHYGILMMCGYSGIISNNTLVNNGFFFDNFSPSEDIELWFNTVNDKPLGYFWGVTSMTINGNQYGEIILANCTDVLVKDGVFNSTSIGIHLFSSSNCTLTSNTISNNYLGISLSWACSNCILMNNTVFNNSIGIRLEGYSNHCTLIYNNISNNSIGIQVFERCVENTFYLNRFVDNSENAIDSGEFNSWDDGFSLGNYWSDYIGTGPYYIPGDAGSVDHYPFGSKFYNRTFATPGELSLILVISAIGSLVVVIAVEGHIRKKKI